MRRDWMVVALLLSLGLNLGLVLSSLLAHPKAGVPRAVAGGYGEGLEPLADELGLAAEKRQAFLARHRQFFAAARAPRERLRELRAELTRELFLEPAERQRINELVAATGTELARFEEELALLVLDIRAMLPAEKQAIYRRFLERLESTGQGASQPPGGQLRGQ